jgi:hypothetical protein
MRHDWLIYITSFVMLLLTASVTLAETNTVSSTVVTNSTPPTANAPTIMNNNSDICKVGVGASVQNNVVGVATGVVIDDELCQKLKLSRSMYAYGMKVAAVSILVSRCKSVGCDDGCRNPMPCTRIYRSRSR